MFYSEFTSKSINQQQKREANKRKKRKLIC